MQSESARASGLGMLVKILLALSVQGMPLCDRRCTQALLWSLMQDVVALSYALAAS